MANQTTGTNGFKKKKGGKGFYGYQSAEGTKPYNELTEAERIAEGTRPNFAENYSFTKSKSDREKLNKFHTNEKGPRGGFSKPNYREIPHRLTVHLVNKRKDPEFVTTYTYDVKRSEIYTALRTFFNYKNTNVAENKRPQIGKVFFNGRIFQLN